MQEEKFSNNKKNFDTFFVSIATKSTSAASSVKEIGLLKISQST